MKESMLVPSTPSFLLALCLALVSGAGEAQTLHNYRCVIERVTSADSSDKHLEFLRNNFVGKEFTVDRHTGVMAGVLKNSYITSPVVVDSGSSENSFKAVTTLRRGQGVGPGSNAYLLVVSEYVTSPKKPFLFAENEDVYLGSCTHSTAAHEG